MGDDVSDITAYYGREVEMERGRLERHQLERDMTWRYFDRYLPSQARILEIGAATGGYTLDLARRGHQVTAVDMTAALLEENKKTIAAAGRAQRVRHIQADARDLGRVYGKDFDAILLMGPLYHLVDEADRKQALSEAFDRLHPGGVIFTAFISRFGIQGHLMKKVPEWIEDQADVRSLLAQGRSPDDHPPGGFRGYFASAAEIAPLHEALGFETLVVAGVEPAISADDESYNKLQGIRRQLWQDLLYELSTEPSIIGASRHLLYIGRKAED